MYVDEVGDASYRAREHVHDNYLSLTGVILELEYARAELTPMVEQLKTRHFNSHPDEPVILHRKELMQGAGRFNSLSNPAVRQRFDEELLALLESWSYRVITVVLDKRKHHAQYGAFAYDPYHYCLQILLERFILFLKETESIGDVMAEKRGKKEDARLAATYTALYTGGTGPLQAPLIQRHLVSGELKARTKEHNVAGLQLADLIAYPGFRVIQHLFNGAEAPGGFSGLIGAILVERKYARNREGKIEGWGARVLP